MVVIITYDHPNNLAIFRWFNAVKSCHRAVFELGSIDVDPSARGHELFLFEIDRENISPSLRVKLRLIVRSGGAFHHRQLPSRSS